MNKPVSDEKVFMRNPGIESDKVWTERGLYAVQERLMSQSAANVERTALPPQAGR